MSRVYSVATLAERWGCSDSHIYGLIQSGQLKFFTLGGPNGRRYRIRAEVVEQWESGGGDTQSGNTISDSSMAVPSSGGKMAASASAESLAIQQLK